MNCARPHPKRRGVDAGVGRGVPRSSTTKTVRGFTLAEVLAAMVFLAIVIPVAVEGLRIAGAAGQVGLREPVAARVAERVLNEWLATSASVTGTSSGTAEEGPFEFRWTLRSQLWAEDAMQLVTVDVFYDIQGREHEFRLATLADPNSN